MPFISAAVALIASAVSSLVAVGSFIVGGAGLGALTIGGIGIGQIALTAGLIGLNYALTPKNKATVGSINDPGTRGNTRQAIPSHRFLYGTVQVGGAIFILDDSQPPSLVMGLLLSARRIDSVVSAKIGTNTVTFDGDRKALNSPFRVGSTAYLRGSFRLGTSDQAMDPILKEMFPTLGVEDGPVDTFLQTGHATAVFEFKYGTDRTHFETLWGQVAIPNPFVLVKGSLVYDPRDPTQDVDDESTWKWSDNATLIQADWARHPDGVGEKTEDADWEKIAESADYDDELVALKAGGTQKRHTINGVVTLNQPPRDVMEALLTANRGALRRSKGRWWIESSKPRNPVATITDKDIVSGFDYRDRRPVKEQYNKLRGRFIAPERDYQEADGPILDRTDLQTEDGEILETTIRAPFTDTHQALQRMEKQFLLESRLGKTWAGTVRLRLLGIDVGNAILISSKIWPQINGIYMVENWGFADDFSAIRLQLREYDKTISTNWNPQTDEQDFELPELEAA